MKTSLLFLSLLLFPFSLFGQGHWLSDVDDRAGEWWVIPYFWFSEGDSTVKVNGSNGENFEGSLGDIFDFTDYSLSARVEVWMRRWGLTFDFLSSSLWDEAQVDSTTRANLNAKLFFADVGGSYLLGQLPLAGETERELSLELMGGGRFVNMNTDLEFVPGGTQKNNQNWVEPFGGLRTYFRFAERWDLMVRGDVGGFGIGSGSELTWNFVTDLSFYLDGGISLFLGYRILDLETKNESGANQSEFNGRLSGPTLGIKLLMGG